MKYELHGSAGTHFDAPSHFFKEGKQTGDFSIEELIRPFIVIDVSHKMHATLQITKEDVLMAEQLYGPIMPNTFVVGFTGWGKYWMQPEKYRNEVNGKLLFPTFSIEAVQYLHSKGISGVGIDTMSPDPSDSEHPVHQLLLGSGKYIVENMAHLEKIAHKQGVMLIFPLKVACGAEACARVVAAVKKEA
jgi:kynurenine formamidase